jgi:hypothetical protein
MADESDRAPWQLPALGIALEEEHFGRDDEPDIAGCLLAEYVEGGTRMRAVIRPDLADELCQTFAKWAESRLLRFHEVGPEPDGWQKRTSDDAWQLWGRLTQMPELDFTPEAVDDKDDGTVQGDG